MTFCRHPPEEAGFLEQAARLVARAACFPSPSPFGFQGEDWLAVFRVKAW